MENKFDYATAFDRNLGWLTEQEQQKLKSSCVAIAGVGGAGGYQAQALARMGVGRFRIADLDTYELTNMNRQIGAMISTLGQDKTDVMRRMIQDINPEAQVEVFSKGIDEGNIHAFLDGADLAFDGIDFYEIDVKRLLFRHAREKGIPALTCGPFGFGASITIFSPTGMSFDAYFDFKDDMSQAEKRLAMIIGMNPIPFCMLYMDAKKVLSAKDRRGASVCPGLMLVGAISGTEAVKVLTGKSKVRFAPYFYHVDMFTQMVNKKYYPMGMRGPLQKLKKLLFTLKLRTD